MVPKDRITGRNTRLQELQLLPVLMSGKTS